MSVQIFCARINRILQCSRSISSAIVAGNHEKRSFSDQKDAFRVISPMSKHRKTKTIPRVKINFELEDGTLHQVDARSGDSVYEVIVESDLEIDGFGACEGTLSCSTCHVIFNQNDYDGLPHRASDEELDMLDLASGLTDTSRLGCQICVSPSMNGIHIKIPPTIKDVRSLD